MANVKDLIVNGAARVIGKLYASEFVGKLTGNVTGDVSGNATSATKLETARSLNIANSDGTNESTGVNFNGTSNVTLKLPTTIKATFSGNLSGNVTGNVSGSSGSCTGNAATASNLNYFKNTSTTSIGLDSTDANGIGYVSGTSAILSQSDGALYRQVYSSSWVHEIYGDYRTGQIAVRGKNNNTWQDWRTILDSSNYTTWAAPKSHSHSYLPLSGGTMTGNISYKGSQATYEMIKFINNTADSYGNGICIGGGGATLIGGGESADTVRSGLSISGGDEKMVISNDQEITFYTNCQSGIESAKCITMNTDGTITAGGFNGNASSATKLGSSNVGGTTTPIYLSAGTPVALNYTIAKSVPSDAVFTDTKVTSTVGNTTKAYLVGSTSSTDNTGTLIKDTNVYLDTTAGKLVATTFSGSLSGNATSATSATNDSDGNKISSTYLPLSGGTMTGTIRTRVNTGPALNLRNESSYMSTINYDTSGNEALAINLKNTVTSFMVNHGVDGSKWTENGKWTGVTPTLQAKNKCVYINELIPNGTSPSYNLKVNGTSYFSNKVYIGSSSSYISYNSSTGALEFNC